MAVQLSESSFQKITKTLHERRGIASKSWKRIVLSVVAWMDCPTFVKTFFIVVPRNCLFCPKLVSARHCNEEDVFVEKKSLKVDETSVFLLLALRSWIENFIISRSTAKTELFSLRGLQPQCYWKMFNLMTWNGGAFERKRKRFFIRSLWLLEHRNEKLSEQIENSLNRVRGS